MRLCALPCHVHVESERSCNGIMFTSLCELLRGINKPYFCNAPAKSELSHRVNLHMGPLGSHNSGRNANWDGKLEMRARRNKKRLVYFSESWRKRKKEHIKRRRRQMPFQPAHQSNAAQRALQIHWTHRIEENGHNKWKKGIDRFFAEYTNTSPSTIDNREDSVAFGECEHIAFLVLIVVLQLISYYLAVAFCSLKFERNL
ncbi:hypothetical protein JTB14_018777 [Gonioctena quinquepunctata]|nr:hypothetical protein JTB14_018777 [Gonioctena quinquepunctata]